MSTRQEVRAVRARGGPGLRAASGATPAAIAMVMLLASSAWADPNAAAIDANALHAGSAATPSRELTRVERLQLLEIQKAELALEQARADREQARANLDEIRALYEERIYTKDDLNKAEQSLRQAVLKHDGARIDLEQKRLEFLKDATLVTVTDAVKYRGTGGQVLAGIRLRNDSDLNKARIAMTGSQEADPNRLASLLKVDNVLVTLRGETYTTDADGRRVSAGKAIVGDPFQQIIRSLGIGEERTLEFRLLNKDAESVTVSLEFLGQTRDYDVFLKMESRQDLPEVTSAQYSQIGELGKTISYSLTLNRLAKTEQAYALTVLGLPAEIKACFRATNSEALLTEIRFTEETTKQTVDLEVSLPEKLDPALVDRALPVTFLAMAPAERRKLADLVFKYGGEIPADEMNALKAAKVVLTLVPRGVGKLEIVSPNLFTEVAEGQGVELKFNVLNSGTLVLRRITPVIDPPLEWEVTLDPPELAELAGGQKALFKVHLRPSADATIGEYTVKVAAEGSSGTDVIEAADKDFTVRIEAKSNLTGTIVLVGVLIVLVVGIAIASIKISRR